MQDKLREALDDKKELEIEFVALKKNFLNLQADLDNERVKNDNIGVELVNLVNENKVLTSSTDKSKVGESDQVRKLANELQDAKDALLTAKNEVERLKTDLMRMELESKKNV